MFFTRPHLRHLKVCAARAASEKLHRSGGAATSLEERDVTNTRLWPFARPDGRAPGHSMVLVTSLSPRPQGLTSTASCFRSYACREMQPYWSHPRTTGELWNLHGRSKPLLFIQTLIPTGALRVQIHRGNQSF